MSLSVPPIYESRRDFSRTKLEALRRGVKEIEARNDIAELTVFVAGSFAREEASEFSDIDLFFVIKDDQRVGSGSRTAEFLLFSDLIRLVEQLGFPPFSGDGKYLHVHSASAVLDHLGSPEDDARNFFTLRLLMILESEPLIGEQIYRDILGSFIGAYFRDYPKHIRDFEPTFLFNDVSRYWRTLLANYENKRNRPRDRERVEQKIRNYKVKYSRLTTCFSFIGALAAGHPVTEDRVLEVAAMTPLQRMLSIAEERPELEGAIQEVLTGYAEFLSYTALSAEALRGRFAERDFKQEVFGKAESYGDSFFQLLEGLDRHRSGQRPGLLRTLAV